MTGSSDRPRAKASVKEYGAQAPTKEKVKDEGLALEGLFPSAKSRLVPPRSPMAGSAADRYRPKTDEPIEDSRLTSASATVPMDPTSTSSTTAGSQSPTQPTSKTAQKVAPRLEQNTEVRTAELNSDVRRPHGKRKTNGKENAVPVDTIRVQETVVGTRHTTTKPDVTSASQLRQKPTRTDVRALAAQKSRQSNSIRAALAILALVVIGFAIKSQMGPEVPTASAPEVAADFLGDRVRFHKNEVGRRLNRERIGVQYENAIETGQLPDVVKKVPEPDILAGLPLAGEQPPVRERSRDRGGEKVNPAYSDAHVQSSLLEQQQINEWEKVAQKQYVDEFIANAARAGYKVKVDSAGNVSVVGRYPAAQGDGTVTSGPGEKSGPAGNGSVR